MSLFRSRLLPKKKILPSRHTLSCVPHVFPQVSLLEKKKIFHQTF